MSWALKSSETMISAEKTSYIKESTAISIPSVIYLVITAVRCVKAGEDTNVVTTIYAYIRIRQTLDFKVAEGSTANIFVGAQTYNRAEHECLHCITKHTIKKKIL
ncbi:hypothetical protein EVAR_80072_1 [Eumeta japonica]|uniref:Uncharacterized protein n=1 Tax=Eumeta variegata TaxID=151549 RepID=A0A4C1UCZ1_EUMVA|nr:hypothetical protein EVAR_80072_1 [Eumeta japonica]